MTDSVTSLIWRAAGCPAMQNDHAGQCRTCGIVASGMAFSAWVKPTFTDQDKLSPGETICPACQFCFTDQSTELAASLGKEEPQRMRNYSHFVVRGEWIPLSKAHKTRMREILTMEPEVAVIADSGQKHIIFRANPGWWQFEELSIRPFPRALDGDIRIVEALYRGGFSKAEIETGRYIQHRIREFGLGRWRELESIVKPLRGTARLTLALYLAQKEGEHAAGDRGQVAETGVGGDTGQLQDEVRSQHLGAIRGANKKRRVHVEPPALF